MSDQAALVLSEPTLYIGSRIAIDCRFLDRVELANRFTDLNGFRVILALGDVEVSFLHPETRTASSAATDGEMDASANAKERPLSAQELIVAIAPLTTAAPISTERDYHRLLGERDALLAGNYLPPPILYIDGEEVSYDRSDATVNVGRVHYRMDILMAAAKAGDAVELMGGLIVPAALFSLVLAVSMPPNLAVLEQRLREYEESQRPRNPS